MFNRSHRDLIKQTLAGTIGAACIAVADLSATELDDPIEQRKATVALWIADHRNPKLTEVVARYAEPTLVTIDAETSIHTAIKAKCGISERKTYLKLFYQANSGLDATDPFVHSKTTITLPACAYWSGHDIWKSEVDQETVLINIGADGPKSVNKARSSTLRRSKPLYFTVNDNNEFASEIFGAIGKNFPGFEETCNRNVYYPIISLCEFENFEIAYPVSSGEECDSASPVPNAEEINEELLRKKIVKIPNVHIIDTGLLGAASKNNWSFRKHYDEIIRDSVIGVTISYDPKIRAKLEADSSYNPPKDVSKEDALAHGTHVAGIVAGHAFSKWDHSRIDLSIINVILPPRSVGDRKLSAGFSYIEIDAAVQLAIMQSADVINLSLSTNSPYHLRIADATNTVFVVASGNKKHELSNITPLYPAISGGPRRKTITVGALDGSELMLAPFSNWSDKFVDIAAPGCRINSVTNIATSIKKDFSGTSQAAPFVALASALLRSVGFGSSGLIKERLLSSSRPVKALRGKVASVGVLDIATALKYDRDVIFLTKNSKARDVYGRSLEGKIKNARINLCRERQQQLIRHYKQIAISEFFPEAMYKEGEEADLVGDFCPAGDFTITVVRPTDEISISSKEIEYIVLRTPHLK